MKKMLLPCLVLLLLSGCEKEQIVTVDDGADAELSFRSSTADLKIWPPDNTYHTLTIEDMLPGLSDDYSGDLNAATITIDEVSSDEAEDDPSTQDGSTTDDIVIAADCGSVQLRRERMNAGNGRVYTVKLSINDGGGTTPAEYIVAVPRWPWGWYSNAVDDGPSYVVAGDCGGGGCSTDGLLEVAIDPDGTPGNGDEYTLYVHPEDQRTSSPAGTNGVQWGGDGTDLPLDNIPYPDYAAALADFNGSGNTQTIVEELDNIGETDYAAKICSELIDYGCDDWYLPALGELQAMYDQLGGIGQNGFDSYWYWSSTEIDATYAWITAFHREQPVWNFKYNTIVGCRCVRKE